MSRRRSATRTRRLVAVLALSALAVSGAGLLVPAAPAVPTVVTVGE